LAISRFSLRSLETKCHLDVGPVEKHKVYQKGEGGAFPPQVWAMMSLMSPCCPCFILTPKVFQLCINHLVLVLCRSVSLFLVPSWSSNTLLYPFQTGVSKGACPDFLFFSCFQFGFTFKSIKKLGGASRSFK